MTKEITKAIILQQLTDKFKLREFEPEIFTFSERVVPVYEIGRDVQAMLSDYKNQSITSASGFRFFTVPQNERWFLSRYTVVLMAAGAYTVTGVYIRRVNEKQAAAIYLDMTAGQTVSYLNDLPKEVRLDPGDALDILIDGYTSTADLRLYIDYYMEEIR